MVVAGILRLALLLLLGSCLGLTAPCVHTRVRILPLRSAIASPAMVLLRNNMHPAKMAANDELALQFVVPPRGTSTIEEQVRFLGAAVLIGLLTGLAVALFKTSIAFVAATCYQGDDIVMPYAQRLGLGGAAVLIPAGGGLAVGLIRLASPRQVIGPGLAEHVAEVERTVQLRPTVRLHRSLSFSQRQGPKSSLTLMSQLAHM